MAFGNLICSVVSQIENMVFRKKQDSLRQSPVYMVFFNLAVMVKISLADDVGHFSLDDFKSVILQISFNIVIGPRMKIQQVLSYNQHMRSDMGAVVGYLIFGTWLTSWVLGAVMAAVAGIMVYISLDELLPAAREYGEHHLSIYGLIGGMVLMGSSLLLLK